MPKIVTSAKVPADAKLELVEPPPTIERARAGHGVASRSLKRSSKSAAALKKSSSDAQALDGSGKRRRGAVARKTRDGGLPVGVLVAIPIVLVFAIGLLLLAGGDPPPPPAATTTPASTSAPAALPPPSASSPAPTRDAGAPAPPTGGAPAARFEQTADERRAAEEAEAAAEAEHAELLRKQSREALEAERRMIEELERKAGDAPAGAPAADDASAALDDEGE